MAALYIDHIQSSHFSLNVKCVPMMIKYLLAILMRFICKSDLFLIDETEYARCCLSVACIFRFDIYSILCWQSGPLVMCLIKIHNTYESLILFLNAKRSRSYLFYVNRNVNFKGAANIRFVLSKLSICYIAYYI